MSLKPHWVPSAQYIRDSGYDAFRRYLNQHYGTDFGPTDYWSLHAWVISSPENINRFWEAIWDFGGVIGERGSTPLFDAWSPMSMTRDRFGDTHLNWAENMLLSHPHAHSKTQMAIISLIEGQKLSTPKERISSSLLRQLTFEDLYIEVAQAASALKKLGVSKGDRVAALIPNNAEAIIMVLATSSIGAVWSSSSPELGEQAILERFIQFQPKVLVSADKFRFQGKNQNVLPKLSGLAVKLSKVGLKYIVVVGQLEKDRHPRGKDFEAFSKTTTTAVGINVIPYPQFLDRTAKEIEFYRGKASDPLWVLFSSGTTGKPKAIIHSQGAMVITTKQYGFLHSNCKAGDSILQITTTGWMMWNAMVNHLSMGMCVVTYDGNPFFPHSLAMFDVIDAFGISSFSLGPRYLQIIYTEGHHPRKTHSLQSLKTISSAGAPLKAELYAYIKHSIKHVYINNASGGTDICGGFVGGCPVLPVYAGLIQCPLLGIALESWNDDARPVALGEEGDMVITKPFPNMPIGFLGDDAEDSKLRDTYFDHYPGKTVWYQGDFVSIDPETKGVIMQGRSDGVLNPQGVRFGSAEIYAVVEELKDIVDDCIVVGQKTPDGDERVVLFVKPHQGNELSSATVQRIKDTIATRLSRRHVPAKVIDCPDIPYTTNGKRVEVAVKKIVNGAKPSSLNTGSMLNPHSLTFFVGHPDLSFSRAHPSGQHPKL